MNEVHSHLRLVIELWWFGRITMSISACNSIVEALAGFELGQLFKAWVSSEHAAGQAQGTVSESCFGSFSKIGCSDCSSVILPT